MLSETSTPQNPKTPGRTIGVWMSGLRLEVFENHVGKDTGLQSDFIWAAIAEKLAREGIVLPPPKRHGLQGVQASLLADLGKALKASSPEAVKAKLAELNAEPAALG